MISKSTATNLLQAAALSAALATASAAAIAAQGTPGQVETGELQTVVVKHLGRGMQQQVEQVSQQVSYADLDLATRKGAHELTNRIERTAKLVCERLGTLYPEGSFIGRWQNERACVGDATQGAMKQAKAAIASAKAR